MTTRYVDPRRSAAAKRAAATRRRRREAGEATRWLGEASVATENMIVAFRAEGLPLPLDADELRLIFAHCGAAIDRKNGYDSDVRSYRLVEKS